MKEKAKTEIETRNQYLGSNGKGIIRTYLSKTLEAVGGMDSMYNEHVLNMIADKQVLARILRDSVEEFYDLDLDTIMDALDEPQIRKMRLEPGLTNLRDEDWEKYGKVFLEDSADIVQNEGAIYFDIRGSAFLERISFKLLYDVEPQRETYESRLGYPVESRMVFYGARLISSQKDTEFFGEDYGNIKKSVTIWIIPISSKQEDGSIEMLDMTPKIIHGVPTGMLQGGLMQGVLIGFRKGKNIKKSENRLISFLEDLFGDEPFEVKREKLIKEHGVVMEVETERRVNIMCNYASLIREEAREEVMEEMKGYASLIREETILESVKNVMQSFGVSIEQAMDALKINENDRGYILDSIKG